MSPETTVGPLQLSLALALIVTAAATLYSRHRLTGVVLFLVFGVFLSIYWGVIGAPDVALAEAVIGTGVTGALFGYTATVMPRPAHDRRGSIARTIAGLAGGAGIGAGLGYFLTRAAAAPPGGSGEPVGLTGQATAAVPATGVEHPITGVLLNLRSYDTLMEMVVLLSAATVAVAFAPRSDAGSSTRGGAPASEQRGPAAPPIVRGFVSLVAPVVLLFAAWLLFAGSTQPGGAFQAGAALAAVMILVQTSGVGRLRIGPAMICLLLLGVLAFIAVGLGGLVLGDAWLLLRGEHAGTVTIALECILAVTIGASLAAVFLASAGRRR
ncbi:DUF4040 domain-containing protein [Kocuria coralli]|uniref:DUF4040 domain-containing protein n=1 Tax=Kocuria coralli TaxID=1461025 RepID=A0A5J5L3R8_9MICC|nr:hydrogenase subunit MbhD domain-containing protein [Kocuria coralli]KAA9395611.1 DUF4040 domain-containing protein [Kocuria coralli]